MKEVTLWLLLSISNGWDSQGVVTKVGMYKTLDECIATEIQMKDDKFKRVHTKCIQSKMLFVNE